jgi:HD superfamily phosphohydrolase
MLLVRSLGGSVMEQAAGLLHDAAHTAFSHVADIVLSRRDESSHDDELRRLLSHSDVGPILARYGIKIDSIQDANSLPLLLPQLPDLSADRIDYTLRDLQLAGLIANRDAKQFVAALEINAGRIVVNGPGLGLWFARKYHQEVVQFFMDPLELYANAHLAAAIKLALERGVIQRSSLFLRDDELLSALNRDVEIRGLIAVLRAGIRVVEDDRLFDYHVFSKARIVDPWVRVDGGAIKRSSELSDEVQALHTDVLRRTRTGSFVRLVQEAAGDHQDEGAARSCEIS